MNFAAGGIATPADAALMMQLSVDGVFVGSGIFKSGNPEKRAKAIVQAVTHYNDPLVLAKVPHYLFEKSTSLISDHSLLNYQVSEDLGEPMVGINCDQLEERWAKRESGHTAPQ